MAGQLLSRQRVAGQLLTRQGMAGQLLAGGVAGQLLPVQGGVAGQVDQVVLRGGGEAVLPPLLVQGAVGTRLLQDPLL